MASDSACSCRVPTAGLAERFWLATLTLVPVSLASFLAAAVSCSTAGSVASAGSGSPLGSLASPFHMVSGAAAVPAGWRSGMPESNSGVLLADSSAGMLLSGFGAGVASARSLLAATWLGLGLGLGFGLGFG